MNKYLICCQFTKPIFEYENFHRAISSYESTVKLFSSVYIIITNSNADLILENLSPQIKPDDKLFITKIDEEYAGKGFD